jgi:SAM-dependent methyltransferase
MFHNLPQWTLELAGVSAGDDRQPSALDGINLALNRLRLAGFLSEFADDQDVQNLLALDALSSAAGLPLSSTGRTEAVLSLAQRPFRLWEYTWLYKTLNLSAGGARVLDLGGPATHLTMLTALSGCRVTTLDISAQFVSAARECALALQIDSLDAQVVDMRDLSPFSDNSFDAVVCCSVLEHLTRDDQEIALREMARVLRPGGLVGLTFDFGRSAAGASVYLPPPHDPPPSAAEALRRFTQEPLVPVGNRLDEDPIPGSLFHHDSILYTMASLFLAKPPAPAVRRPKSDRVSRTLPGALRIADMPRKFHKRASQLETLLNQGEAYRIASEERLSALLEKEVVIQELSAALREAREALSTKEGQIRGFQEEGLMGYVKRKLRN